MRNGPGYIMGGYRIVKTLNWTEFHYEVIKYFYENNNRRHSLVPYATTAVHRLYQVL